MGKHVQPQGPVMYGVGTNIQPVVHSFLQQYIAHFFIVGAADIIFSCAQYDAQPPDIRMVGIRHEINGIIKVHMVVEIAVQSAFDVEYTAHGENIAHNVRMSESEVKGVVAAEAATCGDNALVPCFLLHSRNDLIFQHAIITVLVPGPFAWMRLFVVPCETIETVRAVNFHFALLQEPGCRLYQVPVFRFIIFTHGSREEQYRDAGRSKDQHFHFAFQYRGVPAVKFLLHAVYLRCYQIYLFYGRIPTFGVYIHERIIHGNYRPYVCFKE